MFQPCPLLNKEQKKEACIMYSRDTFRWKVAIFLYGGNLGFVPIKGIVYTEIQ